MWDGKGACVGVFGLWWGGGDVCIVYMIKQWQQQTPSKTNAPIRLPKLALTSPPMVSPKCSATSCVCYKVCVCDDVVVVYFFAG